MTTTIVIYYKGKKSYKVAIPRRLTEDEVHDLVMEGLAGRDPQQAEINIYQDPDTIHRYARV